DTAATVGSIEYVKLPQIFVGKVVISTPPRNIGINNSSNDSKKLNSSAVTIDGTINGMTILINARVLVAPRLIAALSKFGEIPCNVVEIVMRTIGKAKIV